MKIIDYPDRQHAAAGVAKALAAGLLKALSIRETASLAVPGGTTPGPVFDMLCNEDLDWSRVQVLASDERWVPADDPRSNGRLIGMRLLTGKAKAAHYVPLLADVDRPEAALTEVAARIDTVLPLSVLLLGMGADMHTASLFPGAEGLDEALRPEAPSVVAMRPDTAPEARVSLSARVLQNAGDRHLLFFGEDKRMALETATTLTPEEAPVQAILQGTTVHWAA